MKKYPNEKNYLYNVGQAVLHAATEFIKAVEKSKMCNEQWFISWEDELNELSIKDHNQKKEASI